MQRYIIIRLVIIILLLITLFEFQSVDAMKHNMSYLYGNYDYVELINKTKNDLNEVSPSYFDINDDGSLHLNTVDNNLIKTAHSYGIKVTPFLSNHWDRTKGRKALSNIEQLTTQIADAIQKYDLDGINVDIENVTEIDRDNYTKLVKVLREKVPADKVVTVAVAPNPYNWGNGWQGSYDYDELSKYADYLMVMTYDEHYESGEEGPVASIQFVEKSIQYALEHVPKEKIVIGIPFYGRYWQNGSSYGGYGVSLNRIDSLVTNHKSTITYDSNKQSAKAVITITQSDKKPTINGRTLYAGTYIFWYENEESIRAKLELVNKYDLKGTGSWSLGQESINTWNYYTNALNNNQDLYIGFADVSNDSWSANYINIVKEKKLMIGKNTYEFAPEESITRAEFATTIARALNLDVKEYEIATFNDTQNHWAKNYIEAIRDKGLMIGNGDGTFCPDKMITRGEVAKVLSLLKVDASENTENHYFKDITEQIWSYEYIIDVVQKGFMNGYPDNTFMPNKTITREEVAAVIVRVFNLE